MGGGRVVPTNLLVAVIVLVVALLFLSILLLYIMYQRTKKAEKGKKVMEVEMRGCEYLTKATVAAYKLLAFAYIPLSVLFFAMGKVALAAVFFVLAVQGLSIIYGKRKIEVYENGVMLSKLKFFEWERAKEVKHSNGYVEIKFGRFGGVRIKDPDKRIYELVLSRVKKK